MNVVHACAGEYCQVCKIMSNPTPPRALARATSPGSSKAAAQDLPVTDLEVIVYEAIRDAGEEGMTQDELLQAFPHLSYSSVTARPAALKRKGMIMDSGIKRPGRSGRMQSVLIDAAPVQRTLL